MNAVRTHAQHPDFKTLVHLLDQELAVTDGDEHDFYHQFNGLENIDHALLIYEGNEPAACGALKKFDPTTMEVKRMYSVPQHRRKGLASVILSQLELWAKDGGYTRCVLETGKRQPDAIALYEKNGYRRILNYGQYANMENSVCFEKVL